MKLNINGYARHGKDTVADMFVELHGLKKIPASMIYAKAIRDSKYLGHYDTVEECYEDRVNHRAAWYDFIRHHSKEDPEFWVKQTLIDGKGDIYVGHRGGVEYFETRHLFDATIWVDASARGLPKEPESSCDLSALTPHDFYVDNGQSLAHTEQQVNSIMMFLQNKKEAINAYS